MKSDEIIHPAVAEPGFLQADADLVPDNYQPDEQLQDPTPEYRTTIAEDTGNHTQIRKKAAKWGDAELRQMDIHMEAHPN